jgi:hypothetical protein
MASNKNQHFVPRVHLRPFTVAEGDAAINVFNLDRKRLIPNAPVKSQCSRDYFYGRDEKLESAIRTVEGAYGSVLNDLRRPGHSLEPRHKTVLLRFWLLQSMRTEAASRRSVEMAADLHDFSDQKDAFALGIKEAVQIAMRTYADATSITDDLKSCLVRNRTSIPFITSDDPAVLANRWYLEDKRIRGRSFGLQSSGALAILPLTPKLAFLAYDGDVYSIPHQNGWVDAKREADVRALNQHQLLNCFANVFLHDMQHGELLINQYEAVAPRRPAERRRFHVAVRDMTVGDHTRYRVVSPEEAKAAESDALFHSESVHYRPSHWPAFIRWRTPGAVYTNGTGLKYVRAMFAATIRSHREFWREAAR